jgi:DNA helicase-2/ATP-dependent DNA helicase PcrA
MLFDEELSAEQLLTLEPHIRLIEACPGAGKTRAVVQRFKTRAQLSKRGVALLSFTNAAIDEAASRCADRPDLMRAPHFVGTFDTFLHRYIVTPAIAAVLKKAPTYLQSWDELPEAIGGIRMGQWQRLALSNFSHSRDGSISLRLDGLRHRDRLAYAGLSTDAEREAIVRSGIARIESYNESGLFDSDSARWRALALLRGTNGASILASLGQRFSDVIVDEFQDSAALEHDLLYLLGQSGMHITVVADPDQSIFAFRQAEPQLYEDYRAAILPSAIVTLSTNYRSSPAICALVQALRARTEPPVVPNRLEDSSAPPCVYVLGGSVDKVRSRFLELAQEWNIPLGERVALAHRGSEARTLAAGGQKPPDGASMTAELLRGLATLRSSGSSLTRRKALSSLQRLFVRVFAWTPAQAKLDSLEKLELLGKDRLWVRLVIGALLAAVPSWTSPEFTGASIRTILKEQLDGLPVPLEGRLGSKFKKPDPALWAYWNDAGAGRDQTVDISWSTIHAAKGTESDGVLLKVPDAAVVSSWLAGEPSEERRVFYVGASRARKLLVLQVSAGRLDQLGTQLRGLGLPIAAEKLV